MKVGLGAGALEDIKLGARPGSSRKSMALGHNQGPPKRFHSVQGLEGGDRSHGTQ